VCLVEDWEAAVRKFTSTEFLSFLYCNGT